MQLHVTLLCSPCRPFARFGQNKRMEFPHIAALVGGLICSGVFAQTVPSAPMNVPVRDDWRNAQIQDAWHFTVGLGLSDRPTYLGANSHEIRASPLVSAT
jgi:hypothetical protein